MNQLFNHKNLVRLHHLIRTHHLCTNRLPARQYTLNHASRISYTELRQAGSHRRAKYFTQGQNKISSSMLCISNQWTSGEFSYRNIHTGAILYDQPSSKVETVVENIKQKEKERSQVSETEATAVVTKPVVKKTLGQRIWAELVHYYHGFRLLFIDINVCRKLLWRVLNGKTLTRREHKLLVRTTSDIFRLVPFSVFIIVPFMELLLPLAIKLFPGMLPSTFQTATEYEDKMKQNLKVKLEMAKFLQKTLDEMTVKNIEHRSEAAKEFSVFFHRVRNTGDTATNEEIIKFSKLFEDEITLDSLARQQLTALCRVLEINTIGTSAVLRFQLEMKLRSLTADDRVIQKEGIDSLNLVELQNACRARGMRAYGLSEDQLRQQLSEWIDLSLNEKVPPSLLLLSRALMIPENVTTGDKLKATISALPENVVTQAKAAIGEKEGKIDNKTKIEVIKEEERKIKEEKEEQIAIEKETADSLVDRAPVIGDAVKDALVHTASLDAIKEKVKDQELSTKDLEMLEDALETLSASKNKLILEKEEIRDLKEEIADYQEDVQELLQVADSTKIQESSAAKLLYRKVNSMIGKLDTVLETLEEKEKRLKRDVEELIEDEQKTKTKEELVRIDELMMAIKHIQTVPDASRAEHIEKILGKIDDDHDGKIKVDDVLKIIETIGSENIKLQRKQVDELIDLLNKEEVFETEKKIEKALAKSSDEKSKVEATMIDSKNILENASLAQNPEENDSDKHILKAPTSDETPQKQEEKPSVNVHSFDTAVPPISSSQEKNKLKDSTL
ncbi:mitochondrial proton/calcium exchanger protein [Culicoides brevitarsis]|uniref:mitochondrial proton/calcium exchanger protein n=1 Tax=Culicoides brevitarsis TaxID=469753 RepID=UPI00307C2AB3